MVYKNLILPSGIKHPKCSLYEVTLLDLPWLQFSSSLWSMQSNTSSQRQRRGIQWARFRQRNSSSLHSFTQPTCQQGYTVNHQKCLSHWCCQLQSGKTKTLNDCCFILDWSMTGQAAPHICTVHCEAAQLERQTVLSLLLWIVWNNTDLIWAIQTVIMSITPQAGWHTTSTGTHILVHGTWRDCWRRAKYISQ